MEIRYSPNPVEYQTLHPDQLRAAFLVENLFAPGQLNLVQTDADRAVIGSAVPIATPIKLSAEAELRAAYFCERRELGVLSIGGDGAIEADGVRHEMGRLDCLYIGRGRKQVNFSSRDPANPAAFFLLSYPAHATHPTIHAHPKDAAPVELGTMADANRRTIYKYIHPGGIKSCQIVMGFTQLHEGSVWNTMPAHTHARRSEIYLYFDLPPKRHVMHFMGAPKATRHLVVADRQAVISPSWSIHSGCGIGNYTFCWGMGGENQTFEDMEPAPADQLR
jgi:4-deoxy-L-threo-5-hexosulose-uronate ketol-isomerase